jgi:hypothetical protein
LLLKGGKFAMFLSATIEFANRSDGRVFMGQQVG